MISEQLQQQIEAYLDGNLSGNDLTEFEAKIQTDKALATEVALYRAMEDLLGEEDVMDFKDTLNSVMPSSSQINTDATLAAQPEVKAEATVKKLPTNTNYRRWLSIAAGIALVALIGSAIYSNLTTVSPESLYVTNMEFPTALGGGALRSSDESSTLNTPIGEIAANWESANDAYQQKQFGAALLALDNIEEIDPNFDLVYAGDYFFKKGLVQLKLEKPEAAIASFKKVMDGDYVSNAQWKIALTLLIVNPAEAKIALEKIANSNHVERAKAATILGQL